MSMRIVKYKNILTQQISRLDEYFGYKIITDIIIILCLIINLQMS